MKIVFIILAVLAALFLASLIFFLVIRYRDNRVDTTYRIKIVVDMRDTKPETIEIDDFKNATIIYKNKKKEYNNKKENVTVQLCHGDYLIAEEVIKNA